MNVNNVTFDPEEPNCTNCGTTISLEPDCEWPEEPELCLCNQCSHTLLHKLWQKIKEIENK